MAADQPLVSVCIPAYNCAEYIRQTVESVTGQTYANLEIIIVDDGSADDTKNILKGLTDKNIRIYHQQNKGAAAARNLAYLQSKGEYIKFLDADDIISPEMIDSQLKLAIENPDSMISAKWGRFYNNNINTFKLTVEDCWTTLPGPQWLCTSWKNGSSVTQPGIFLLPRAVIERAGLWDEQLTLIDDLDFFTRIILNSRSVIFDPDAVLYYRSGNNGSLSNQKQQKDILSAYISINKATSNLLAIDKSEQALKACADVWQRFIYTYYLYMPGIINAAQKKLDDLGGSALEFPSGRFTKILVKLIGWKNTKRVKYLLKINE